MLCRNGDAVSCRAQKTNPAKQRRDEGAIRRAIPDIDEECDDTACAHARAGRVAESLRALTQAYILRSEMERFLQRRRRQSLRTDRRNAIGDRIAVLLLSRVARIVLFVNSPVGAHADTPRLLLICRKTKSHSGKTSAEIAPWACTL